MLQEFFARIALLFSNRWQRFPIFSSVLCLCWETLICLIFLFLFVISFPYLSCITLSLVPWMLNGRCYKHFQPKLRYIFFCLAEEVCYFFFKSMSVVRGNFICLVFLSCFIISFLYLSFMILDLFFHPPNVIRQNCTIFFSYWLFFSSLWQRFASFASILCLCDCEETISSASSFSVILSFTFSIFPA